MTTFTIEVDDNVKDKFLWLLKHFEGEVRICESNESYLSLREEALADYVAGKTVSLEDFDTEFCDGL